MNDCQPPKHTYKMFGYPGTRNITCTCGRTRSKFKIQANDGRMIVASMNVQEAIEGEHVKLVTSD